MNQFLIETGIILVVAFIVGAMLGCFLRSLFVSGTRPVYAPEETTTSAADTHSDTPETARMEPESSEVISVAHSYLGMAEADQSHVAGLYTDPKDIAARFASNISSTLVNSSSISRTATETIASAATVATATVATATAGAAAASPSVSQSKVETDAQVVGAAADDPASGSSPATEDQLSLIKGIDSDVVSLFNQQGITRFQQIANWGPDDVASFNAALASAAPALGVTRVETGNWIEQAKMLSAGHNSLFSSKIDVNDPSFRPHQKFLLAGIPASIPQGSGGSGPSGASSDGGSEPSSGSHGSSGDLSAAGVGFTVGALTAASSSFSFPSPSVQVDNLYDTATVTSDFDTLMSPPRPGKTRRIYSGNVGSFPLYLWDDWRPHNLTDRPIFRKSPRRTPEDFADRDDLKKLPCVGVILEKRLNAAGIKHYEQIATMSAEEVIRIGEKTGIATTLNAAEWITRAKRLAEQTAPGPS